MLVAVENFGDVGDAGRGIEAHERKGALPDRRRLAIDAV